MSEPPSPEPDDQAPRSPLPDGFVPLLTGALGSLLDHLEARAELFQWELREARSRLIGRLLCLLGGVLVLLSAYAVAIAALVGWLAQSRSLSWPTAALLVALGQILFAGVLLLLARRGGGPLFSDSRTEWRRDRELLRRKAPASRAQRSRPDEFS